MFFASHYQRKWFDSWEPKWYTGFSVMSYPPLAHQILAIFSYLIGLESAYVMITILLAVMMPLGVYKFSKVFVSDEAARYASLISVFLPSIIQSIYNWGQYPMLFSIVATLFTTNSINRYLKEGGLIPFIKSICLCEVTISAHHLTGIAFTQLLLFVVFFTRILKRDSNLKSNIKRFFLFLGTELLFSVIIIYPFLFGLNIQNVHIPHPTTFNYFYNKELFNLFFLNMYGFILLLIPITFFIILNKNDLRPLFILSTFFLILGFGGTTPLPRIVFGENWLGLTYGKFSSFAGISFLPLLGLVCIFLNKRRDGKSFLVIFFILSILFASWVGNKSMYLPRSKEVPIDQLVGFLDRGEHWRWRYLTLGFGSYDFARLSILSNATTLDGYYYRGRNIPVLADSGVGYLGAAKFFDNGLFTLKEILENASEYCLKFVLCNDRYYEPLLKETGFTLVPEKYDSVTIWSKKDMKMLNIDEIVNNNHVPDLSEYLWGIVPILWLIGSLLPTLISLINKLTNILT